MLDDLLARAIGVLLLLAAVTAVALLATRRRGTVRPVGSAPGPPDPGLDRLRAVLGSAALPHGRPAVVQVSSEYCTPCRESSRSWRAIAADEDLTFLEVDGGQHLDLARTFGVLATPTSLIFDGAGRLVGRVTGAPSRAQARTAVATAT